MATTPTRPCAYFLTYRTYATWLPGAAAGFIDHARHAKGPGAYGPNPELERIARLHANHPPVTLGERERKLVDGAIRAHAQHKRWHIHALNVRTNHVHIVVTADAPPRRVAGAFKAWSTRALRREAGWASDRKVWARNGSAHPLWSDDALLNACEYTLNAQSRNDR